MASKKSERKVTRKGAVDVEKQNRKPIWMRTFGGSTTGNRKAATNRVKSQVQKVRDSGHTTTPGVIIATGPHGHIAQKPPHPKRAKKANSKPNKKGIKGHKTGTIAHNPKHASPGSKAAHKGKGYSQGVKLNTKAPSASSRKK